MKEKLIQYRLPIIVGVVSFNVGIGVGYIISQRRRNKVIATYTFDDQLKSKFTVDEVEIPDPPESSVIVKEDHILIDGEAYNIETNVKTMGEPIIVGSEEPQELVTKSVFDDPDDDWDFALEISTRSLDKPYVIHREEFYADEKDYTQCTLTYYAGDNIMCDEQDVPVYNHETITGPLLFGHGSHDPNVVHIRNDTQMAEYEICYDPGLYSVDVLGLDIENNQRVEDLKHSKNRKFRLE